MQCVCPQTPGRRSIVLKGVGLPQAAVPANWPSDLAERRVNLHEGHDGFEIEGTRVSRERLHQRQVNPFSY
jgi:hypothetical protein